MGLELTFSVEIEEFGVREVRELKPNGKEIPVSDENKEEYVRLVCQMKMAGELKGWVRIPVERSVFFF